MAQSQSTAIPFMVGGTLSYQLTKMKDHKRLWIILSGFSFVPFSSITGPTAFMLGNEGQGLSTKQMSLCDRFVYIPQHGCGTASLNVAVACSIVLHHFALWAGLFVCVCVN